MRRLNVRAIVSSARKALPMPTGTHMTRWFSALFAAILLAGSGSWTVAPAVAATGSNRLSVHEILKAGEFLVSQNGSYYLRMQDDGNLVLYAPGNVVRWSSNTRGSNYLGNQGDGNLVVRENVTLTPRWDSRTAGWGPSDLILQDDGNLVLYSAGNVPRWSSNNDIGFIGNAANTAIQPVSGRVTGVMSNRCFNNDWNHYGVDIAAPKGTPIIATAAGTVIAVGSDGLTVGRGNYVEIRHGNGYVSRYFHLDRFEPGLAVGQVKTAGTRIGYVGNTGASRGDHLHFEMRKSGNVVNLRDAYTCGATVVQSQPIRLSFPGI